MVRGCDVELHVLLVLREDERLKEGETCRLKRWCDPRHHENVLESGERVYEMMWRQVYLAERRQELHLEVGVLEVGCDEWQ